MPCDPKNRQWVEKVGRSVDRLPASFPSSSLQVQLSEERDGVLSLLFTFGDGKERRVWIHREEVELLTDDGVDDLLAGRLPITDFLGSTVEAGRVRATMS